MTIKAIVRKRNLTSFNEGGGQKAHYPVVLYVYDRGMKYYLSTSFVTNDAKFNGCFNDKGVAYDVNKKRTDALGKLIDELVTWYNINYYTMSTDDVKLQLTAMTKGVSVGQMISAKTGKHMPEYIEDFADTHEKKSTADIYRRTANLVREYSPLLGIEDITLDWLDEFVDWMSCVRVNRNHGKNEVGLKVNTQAIHLRNIKAVLRWLGKPSRHMPNNRVFEEYKIKDEKTQNFYMTEQMVADFRDYPCEPWQEKYRDFCMLSLYLAGVNANDLLLIKELTNGRFIKQRGKTDVQIDLPVCDEAMAIIDKYRGDEYLLGFMDGLADYQTFSQHLNKAIKTIGLVVKVEDKLGKMRKLEYHGLFPDVKMYSFRYSFATICANLDGVSADMVGVCMAHSWALSGNVTAQRYILNNRGRIDKTMRKFIEHMRGFKGRSKEIIDAEIRRRDKIG